MAENNVLRECSEFLFRYAEMDFSFVFAFYLLRYWAKILGYIAIIALRHRICCYFLLLLYIYMYIGIIIIYLSLNDLFIIMVIIYTNSNNSQSHAYWFLKRNIFIYIIAKMLHRRNLIESNWLKWNMDFLFVEYSLLFAHQSIHSFKIGFNRNVLRHLALMHHSNPSLAYLA